MTITATEELTDAQKMDELHERVKSASWECAGKIAAVKAQITAARSNLSRLASTIGFKLIDNEASDLMNIVKGQELKKSIQLLEKEIETVTKEMNDAVLAMIQSEFSTEAFKSFSIEEIMQKHNSAVSEAIHHQSMNKMMVGGMASIRDERRQ